MKAPPKLDAPPPAMPFPCAEVRGVSLRCTYCHDALAAPETVFCGACLAPHHADCFEGHGHCSAPGCLVRETVAPAQRSGPRLRSWRWRLAILGALIVNQGLLLAVGWGRLEIAQRSVAHLGLLNAGLERDVADLRASFSETWRALKEKERDRENARAVRAMLDEERGEPVVRSLILGPPVPAIDAKVAAVKLDVNPGLVLLSVGSDDKVEKGFHFSIYRGAEFVGKVVVEKVLRDACGCRILFTKGGLTIQPGDGAATRLE